MFGLKKNKGAKNLPQRINSKGGTSISQYINRLNT